MKTIFCCINQDSYLENKSNVKVYAKCIAIVPFGMQRLMLPQKVILRQ